ncbi:MAG: hypothetical protein ACKVOU_11630 [Cytophagales bacterium]
METLLIGYLLIQLNTKNESITSLTQSVQTKSTEVEQKTSELELIKADLERVQAEADKLGLDKTNLSANIAELNSAIADLKKTNKLDDKKRKELQGLVAKLREEITKRDKEIADLQMANDSLQTNMTSLSTEQAKLKDSIASTSSKARDVESKLKFASILKAENIKVTVLKSNGKEIEDDEYKASRIDRIKIRATLADNKAAKHEVKEFYIRLKTPDGDVFSDPSNGGGYFNLADGSPLSYTLKQSIEFDNSNQNIELTTFSGLKYIVGFYKVEVYCDGYKIGEGTFKVK